MQHAATGRAQKSRSAEGQRDQRHDPAQRRAYGRQQGARAARRLAPGEARGENRDGARRQRQPKGHRVRPSQRHRRHGERGAGRGQGAQDRVIPEQQLQQQRHIAQGLHINSGEAAGRPVGGQAHHPQGEAQKGGEDDADARHQQGVQQAHQKGLPVGRHRRIGDQRLVDVEARNPIPEIEIGGNAPRAHVGGGVVHRHPQQGDHDDSRDRLRQQSAKPRVMQQRNLWRPRLTPAIAHARAPLRLAAQRTGGAYCRPPLDQRLLRPRLIFSLEFSPTVRSKLSP